ncbi:hypothetical protein K6119_03730 [Paracrocinitomix mangrovi]|uniref:hypothetical protein n=1 Tax=Paracrocinitomix mangrovi TaxID=2862509 RepID=UPI001C8F1013|nr:hypothetical protein [Paracrocinitomix mangrovi]UKN02621.1 hypothetical protein K6119_03730 [Paracrocinitomix mangrovi]
MRIRLYVISILTFSLSCSTNNNKEFEVERHSILKDSIVQKKRIPEIHKLEELKRLFSSEDYTYTLDRDLQEFLELDQYTPLKTPLYTFKYILCSDYSIFVSNKQLLNSSKNDYFDIYLSVVNNKGLLLGSRILNVTNDELNIDTLNANILKVYNQYSESYWNGEIKENLDENFESTVYFYIDSTQFVEINELSSHSSDSIYKELVLSDSNLLLTDSILFQTLKSN